MSSGLGDRLLLNWQIPVSYYLPGKSPSKLGVGDHYQIGLVLRNRIEEDSMKSLNKDTVAIPEQNCHLASSRGL